MNATLAPWLVWLFPFLSFVLIALVLRPFANSNPRLSGYTAIGGIGLAWACAVWVLIEVMAAPHHQLEISAVPWWQIGDFTLKIGLLVDGLTSIMLLVVLTVSLLVQIYSQGYMKGDPGYPRYYAAMSLFTTFMLGMVLTNNLIVLYLSWEGVGLCSYLLIGFWFHKPSAANAAKKAFLITRLGDFGFLAAILLLWANTGTFDIEQLRGLATAGVLAGSTLTWAAIGIFAGAAGKSAQFPLHTWLPDAMEGPTPVSALIHAATMVAAGVFLVARMYPLFEHSQAALTTVAIVGAFTAIFAASMGLVMNDIKRVLAYSTVSQLGYMMLGLATGGVAVGIFHLFNHAFFKALLFLGSGSVNHGTGTFNMKLMGGLRKTMPWTFATFVIASLSLAGIYPLAGFWSKDEILATSLNGFPVLFALALITVFMTAFYMFRAVFLTFGGEYRGGEPSEHHEEGTHHKGPHESPAVMVIPLVILAVLSIGSGWANCTGWFGSFLGHGEQQDFLTGFLGILTHPLPWISLVTAVAGIMLAWAIYSKKWLSAEAVGARFQPLYQLFSHKYWLDDIYEQLVVNRGLINGLFRAFHWFDANVVDGAVNGIAKGTALSGRGLRVLQNGQLQVYGLAIAIGVVAIVACLLIFGQVN
jgi:NADH-quinone oxidoreductase subunit L